MHLIVMAYLQEIECRLKLGDEFGEHLFVEGGDRQGELKTTLVTG
jgi:hypothetical protein